MYGAGAARGRRPVRGRQQRRPAPPRGRSWSRQPGGGDSDGGGSDEDSDLDLYPLDPWRVWMWPETTTATSRTKRVWWRSMKLQWRRPRPYGQGRGDPQRQSLGLPHPRTGRHGECGGDDGQTHSLITDLKGRLFKEQRDENSNQKERQDFMDGDKQVCIISDAARRASPACVEPGAEPGTPSAHHSEPLGREQGRAAARRSHRSNQASGPEYKLLVSSIGGENRFVTSVAPADTGRSSERR